MNFFKSKLEVKSLDSGLRILTTLQKDLNMESLPQHIECFDNSNFQGSFPSSACVVFKNGKPQKKTIDISILKLFPRQMILLQ